MKIKKKAILYATLLLASPLSLEGHTGTIYVDKNGNGIWDKGEKTLSGVCVSDGLHVVRTDKKGRFTLKGHKRERFIFLTTPSGYKTYNSYYQRIDSTITEYDFGLIPYDNGIDHNGKHRFIHITDSEISNTEDNEQWANDLSNYALQNDVAFAIHTGDICYEKGLKAHIKLMNTKQTGIPVYYCLGNHDMVQGKYGEELFENLYGPVYYSFDVAGTHYVVTPMPNGDYRPSFTQDEVCQWLKNDLEMTKDGTPIYIFNHDLPLGIKPFMIQGEKESIDLTKYNLKAWIYGHWHINLKKKVEDVWTLCTSAPDKGGIDHSPGAYRVIEVDKTGELSSRLRYCYLHQHLHISTPKGPTVSQQITVNAYSSDSPFESVECSCFNGDKRIWKDLRLEAKTDWTWVANMPLHENMKGAQLTLKIRAKQKNGKSITKEQHFQYLPEKLNINLSQNWDNLLGNAAHTGPNKPATIDTTLRIAWVKNMGANLFMTTPLIHNGVIYVATVDEDATGKAHIRALDGQTGNTIWKFQTKSSVKNTMAITDERLFAQDENGMLYTLSCTDGKLCWQTQLPVKRLPAIVDGVVAQNGIVYAGTGQALTAFNAQTGKLLWRNSDWNQGEGSTATLSLENDVLIASTQWGALYGQDAKTGKQLWKATKHGLRHRGSSAALHNGLLYLISDQSFFIIEAKTGRIIVRKKLDYSVDVASTPLVTNQEIIFGTARNGVMALDVETLEERWHCPLGESLVYTAPYTRPQIATVETSPVLSGSLVFVAASDGGIYALSRNDGKIHWSHKTGAPCFASISISGNTLIATDFGGNVYAFCTSAQSHSSTNPS